ncbi:hypothetical protein N2152v2_009603 [Parachlorella kessleri]
MRSASLKRRASDDLEVDKENNGKEVQATGKASWHKHKSGAALVFKPFKPPMASRPEANGRSSGRSLGARRGVVPGASALLGMMTRHITVDERFAEAVDEADAPDVVLFDPEEYPHLPESSKPYVRVLVDKFIAAKLRPHQVVGVQFMFKCLAGLKDPNFTGCIQSDSMGLGKTFQSIVTMWMLLTNGIQGTPTCSRTLVLVPSSLVTNWGREVDKWLGGRLKPVVMDDSSGAAVKRTISSLPVAVAGMGRPLVVVCSYTTFRLNKEAFFKKNFQLVICDEAHGLKNGDSQINKAVAGLPCKLRLLLTGTPIQNDLGEYYAMFNTACPGLLGTPSEFRKQFELPILAGRDAGASDKQIERGLECSNKLVDLCSQYMLRRTSTVLKKYLPPKVQQVIFCKMAPLQLALYNGFLRSEPVAAALEGKKLDKDAALATLPAITALKKLCCHPDLVYSLAGPGAGFGGGMSHSGRLVTSKLSEPKRPVVTGFERLQPAFHDPSIYPQYRPGSVQTIHSGKIQVLEALLKAVRTIEPTDKVVIVSNYTESLDLLKQMCDANRWGYLRLDGSASVKSRQPLVDQFNSPQHPSFVLLLSSKAGGVGLNIIGANRLVLFDPDWNPANDQQAMARVWREGQQKHVWIYRLLTTGSIEEKIWQRQLAKEGLSRVVVDDNANESRTFSKDELRALFKVDPTIDCDTHKAIKCKCMGSSSKGSGTTDDDSGSDEEGEDEQPAAANQDSVLSWAHLRDVSTLPDRAWSSVSSFIRDNDSESLERKDCLNSEDEGWEDDGDSAD